MWSLGFSSFRTLMDLWDEAVEKEKHTDKINSMLDASEFIMFFLKGGEVYGAPEMSRLIFAKMKDPDDEENSDDWAEEASFSGYVLKDALKGQETIRLFHQKDLKGLRVIDKDKAVQLLMNQKADKPLNKKVKPPHGEDGGGVIQIKDRK